MNDRPTLRYGINNIVIDCACGGWTISSMGNRIHTCSECGRVWELEVTIKEKIGIPEEVFNESTK